MAMHDVIHVPSQVPVMTLPNAVLFPHAVMTLHIFEERYRTMLEDVLSRDCLFAVALLDEGRAKLSDAFEPPCDTATVGIVRACQKRNDGTSNLLLQGFSRVFIKEIVREEPYRLISVAPLKSFPIPGLDAVKGYREKILKLLRSRGKLDPDGPEQVIEYLEKIEETEAFIDLASNILCREVKLKQKLLSTLETKKRYQLLLAQLETDLREAIILNELKGDLSDDDIALN